MALITDRLDVDVTTTGDDNNGGGYYASGGGSTDYSTQDASQLSLSDLATSGAGVTTVTSATGGFTAAMVDNVIQIRSGTNVDPGFYLIKTRVDTNTITVHTAPDDGVGGIASGVGEVGGSLASPGMAGAMSIDMGDPSPASTIWIKSGNYTLTTATNNVATGTLKPHAATSYPMNIFGYQTTHGDLDDVFTDTTNNPVIIVPADASVTNTNVIDDQGGGDVTDNNVSHITVDGNSQTGIVGILAGSSGVVSACKSIDCTTGFSTTQRVVGCWASGCTTGFSVLMAAMSVAEGCTTGFLISHDAKFFGCLAYRNTGSGFDGNANRTVLVDCISAYNTADGYENTQSTAALIANCLFANNGAYGVQGNVSHKLVNVAFYSNTTDEVSTAAASLDMDLGRITLTADPFEDQASDDFRPNNTAGGGADLRAAGIGLLTQTNNTDIGYLQHADPAGGLSLLAARRNAMIGR